MPIVEPELLIDGDHDAAAFADASTRVIQRCVAHLWQKAGDGRRPPLPLAAAAAALPAGGAVHVHLRPLSMHEV